VRPLTAIDRLSRDFYRRNSYPSRLTLRKIAPSLIPAPWSTHRQRRSPTLERERYGCAFLCQLGRLSPNAPHGTGNLLFRVQAARLFACRSR
jgi:hypothetical protein